MIPSVGDRIQSKYNDQCFCRVVEILPTVIVMEVIEGASMIGSRLVDAKEDWNKHWKRAA